MVLTDKKLFYLGVVNLNRNWWSTSTGIGWSVSTGTGGQFKLVSGGLFDWIFQSYKRFKTTFVINYGHSIIK